MSIQVSDPPRGNLNFAVAFNSYAFLVFFALVLVTTRSIGSWWLRKLALLLFSYLFYAAWNPPFVVLLWISTVIDWFIARAMSRAEPGPRRKLLLAASLVVNLGLLGAFKYGSFLLENLSLLVGALGWTHQVSDPGLFLPIGISFYTFQTLSYTLDVYRGTMKPWPRFLDYALFVTFFPQLVAGPIVRAHEFLPQCLEPKRADSEQLGWGFSLLTYGLFLKVAVADALMAPVADRVFEPGAVPDPLSAWTGSLAFASQVYCDFAGYSYCAIGAGLCLGFALPDNFRFPYAANGFSDFWRRWHISLSRWLRDYVYISLGGNRGGPTRTCVNIMLTLVLSGLWHGASWSFIVWGTLHGAFLVAERLLRGPKPGAPRFWKALLTFLGFTLALTLFRAQTLKHGVTVLTAALGAGAGVGLVTPGQILVVALVTGSLLAFQWKLRDSTLEEFAGQRPWWWRSLALAIMIYATVLTFSGADSAYIYFQF